MGKNPRALNALFGNRKHPRACRSKKKELTPESDSDDDEIKRGLDIEIEDDDTDDETCTDLEPDDSSDSEAENYKPKRKIQKVMVNEQSIFLKAMEKCTQLSHALKAYFDPKNMIPGDQKLIKKIDINGACNIPDNDTTREIKFYQIKGINFLWVLQNLGVGGAILADEMGLGKTIQVIAFLAVLKHVHRNNGPHLVVAPVSVLQNWKQELTRWCPSFNAVVYHGSKKEELCDDRSYGSGEGKRTPFEILITSYSIFEGKSEQMKKDRNFLKKFGWDCVIMDEGHCLKDATSYRNKRLQGVVSNAKQRIMLTGTPIQNDLQELWSLLSFLMPNVFEANEVVLKDLFGARKDRPQDEVLTKMRSFLKPFVMRRIKSEVLDQLPPKNHCVIKCDMAQAPTQEQLYNNTFAWWQCYARNKTPIENKTPNTDILNALTRQERSNIFFDLRKICNHPLLKRSIYTNEDVNMLARKFHDLGVFGKRCSLESVCDTLRSSSDYDLHKLCEEHGGIENGPGTLPNQLALSSTKCQTLERLLSKLHREGHRCLLFSQWTKILDILEWVLNILGYTFIRLDGKTKVEERQDLVNEFNNNKNIFISLISSRAGGQCLNLVRADTVIIHDVDFNPQVDRQAEDRCHHIGQNMHVTVYKLVTTKTVDEGILETAKRKLTLDATILHTPEEIDEREILRTIFTG